MVHASTGPVRCAYTGAMSTAPTRKPQNPGSNGLERIDRETTETAGREFHALLALARLLGRQAARDFVLQQLRSDGGLIEPPEDDA